MMNITEAAEEYKNALKLGQRSYKKRKAAGLDPYPAVLDDILEDPSKLMSQDIPLTEIPAERIRGVRSAGRTSAFSADFLPLLEPDTEFAAKWIRLCADHLSDTGIRDPIVCFEYLGDFYVQEGNKRVSVLRYFGAPKIPALVTRLIPPDDGSPRIGAYHEFLDFHRQSGLYEPQFTKPGCYAKLLKHLGKKPGESWTQEEVRRFSTGYANFRNALSSLQGEEPEVVPEEALLKWLEVYAFPQLGEMTAAELKKSVEALRGELTKAPPANVSELPAAEKKSLIGSIISPAKSSLNVAFVHQSDPENSLWTQAHDSGQKYFASLLKDQVKAKSYYHADDPQTAEELVEQAAEDGAEVVFTTTPSLLQPTLKAAVKYPKVRFINCSPDSPYPSVSGYYVRAFEGKFITGAIAGAMSKSGRIGYIASYPILGVPAAINAFALGAQLTRPDARIVLRWSCTEGDHVRDLRARGIDVISNRDVPGPDEEYAARGEFGTFAVSPEGTVTPLASPWWLWGDFYEKMVRGFLSGAIESKADAANYWLGMKSGVLEVRLFDALPEGVRFLAEQLKSGFRAGTLDPFLRRVTAQDGSVKNDGSSPFTAEELLRMDWLCDNVEGSIPAFSELLPMSRDTVRALGLHRETLPENDE
ncbi:MAG: BMP family ABC transporter substrate-binding protein [Lachnospiraceae bacterium]|nr:BMP family ABC transporter substrate-binding protein [Lachnospiraceae bacterium]